MTDNAMTDNKPYLLRAMHEWICDNDLTPYLYIDTGVNGVFLPDNLLAESPLILNASLSACRNLVLSNDCVTFEARFSGKAFEVYLPIGSVIAIVARENGHGMTFEVSDSLLDEGENAAEDSNNSSVGKSAKSSPKSSNLKIVK